MAGTATEDKVVTLTPEQVDRLTNGLTEATRRLGETQRQMDAQQADIKQTIDRIAALEKQNTDGGSELARLKTTLQDLGARVTQLAEQNTNLLDQIRNQSLRLGQSGQAPDHAYMWRGEGSRGAVFASRQQAVELGYFFMATHTKGGATREYARKWLKEHAADLRYLPNIPQSFVELLGANHDRVMKACINQGFSYAAQDLAGSTTPGSVLVTPQFADTFIRNVELHGAFRRNALVWPMGSDTVYIPRRKSGLSYYWVGEAQAGSETDPKFDMLRAICKKGMMLHQYSSELAEDENSAIALADAIMFEFALAQAYEEDRIGFNGTGLGGNGSSGYAGFFGVLGLSRQGYTDEASEDLDKCLSVTAGTGLDRTDECTLKLLRQMVATCHTWARPNAKWYGHRTVMDGDLAGIETTGGGPILTVDQSGLSRLLGYPVVQVETMPASPGSASTACFAFGDLRRGWVLGDRRAPEIETSEHYAFNTDQLTVRFRARWCVMPFSPTAMVVYVTAA